MANLKSKQRPSLAAEFLSEIEAFLKAHGIAETTFGRAAVNDGHLVRDLRSGCDVKVSKIDRVREFMASYREDAA